MPERIRLRRYKGWALPANTIVVARPSKWGNPYAYRTPYGLARVPAVDGSPWEYENRISGDGTRHDCHHPDGTITIHHVRYMTRAECVETFRRALVFPTLGMHLWWRRPKDGPPITLTVADVQRELAGRNLACWCRAEDPCHADVLLEIANTPTELETQ